MRAEVEVQSDNEGEAGGPSAQAASRQRAPVSSGGEGEDRGAPPTATAAPSVNKSVAEMLRAKLKVSRAV